MNALDKITDHYMAKALKGDFEMDTIRKELSGVDISEEDLKALIRKVDEVVQGNALSKKNKTKGKELTYAGLVAISIGVLSTLGTLLGIFDIGDSFIFVYGPIIGGTSLFVAGKTLRNKEPVIEQKRVVFGRLLRRK